MIRNAPNHLPLRAGMIVTVFAVILAAIGLLTHQAHAVDTSDRIITIHDRGNEKVVLTQAHTVEAALKQAGIALDQNDTVEPKRAESLIATSYTVNIYRARPVIVQDGALREKIMTSHQTASQIAEDAGVKLHDEDKTTLRQSANIASDGASMELVIERAAPFTFVLYGKTTAAYTQARTVGDMLHEKGIKLAANDYVSTLLNTPITANMTVSLSRNGVQTVTEDQDIPFSIETIYDLARPIGYTEVQTPGVAGKRSVTYQVNMQSGVELSRTVIQNVVISQPKSQTQVVGLSPGNGLSRSKGANFFTDSKGVIHRETYYNLPMQAVMSACGGTYSVRPDGVKIDQNGYILIAANLAKYPRCSVVETSLGPGKVYDTGGFVSRYPDGYDLATNW